MCSLNQATQFLGCLSYSVLSAANKIIIIQSTLLGWFVLRWGHQRGDSKPFLLTLCHGATHINTHTQASIVLVVCISLRASYLFMPLIYSKTARTWTGGRKAFSGTQEGQIKINKKMICARYAHTPPRTTPAPHTNGAAECDKRDKRGHEPRVSCLVFGVWNSPAGHKLCYTSAAAHP